MRNAHVVVVVILFAAVLIGCVPSSSRTSAYDADQSAAMPQPERGSGQSPASYLGDTRPIQGNRAVMTVHGLGCPLCAENINKTLATVPGVVGSDIDLATGFVSVRLRGGQNPSRADLARAIIDAGFTLVRIDVPEGGA